MSNELVVRIRREWLETKKGTGFEDLYLEEWETLTGYLWDRAYTAGYGDGSYDAQNYTVRTLDE